MEKDYDELEFNLSFKKQKNQDVEITLEGTKMNFLTGMATITDYLINKNIATLPEIMAAIGSVADIDKTAIKLQSQVDLLEKQNKNLKEMVNQLMVEAYGEGEDEEEEE